MWFMYALITLLMWGMADLYYKKGNTNESNYSHIKTGIIVGLIMGIHATLYLIIKRIDIDVFDLLKYLPVSLCYILSMVIGYKGLKYIELSISSPIQNSSGIITSVLLCIIFKIVLSKFEILGLLLMFIGVLILSIIEIKNNDIKKIVGKLKFQAVVFPIIYCVIDGLGTFLDSIYLDQMSLVSEDAALIAYEYTFLIYGIIMYLYLVKLKGEKLQLKFEKDKIKAAIFETVGQFTYVFAIATNSVITIPIIACYSALSVLLSRIILKEKLNILQYISILFIFSGIIVLGILEGMS